MINGIEKQKPVRELAYSESKLELLCRCYIMHYIPSLGLKGSTSNFTQDVDPVLNSPERMYTYPYYQVIIVYTNSPQLPWKPRCTMG